MKALGILAAMAVVILQGSVTFAQTYDWNGTWTGKWGSASCSDCSAMKRIVGVTCTLT